MSIPEQSGDSFDFCVLFRVYFTGKGAHDRYYVYRLLLSKSERKLFLLQDPVGLYKKDLIDMVPADGADITFDPQNVGRFEELLTWTN